MRYFYLLELIFTILMHDIEGFQNVQICRRTPLFSTMNDYLNQMRDMKFDLIKIASITSRGTTSSTRQQDYIMDIISGLESMNPALDNDLSFSIQGSWTLAYTDTQLFMNSPFFMAIREIMGSDSERAQQIIRLHREATRTGEIGRVRQIISNDRLESQVELNVGILPGPPFSIKGEVVSTGRVSFPDKFTMEVTPIETTVRQSNVFSFLDGISLPLNSLYNSLKMEVKSTLITTYVDEDMRITRNRDDNLFVYLRDDE